ncbi:MAG: PorT family protein [Prevotella sp.]|nr:PorT family protein [Prevotella sp.]MBR1462894.1 PorT family protein [Prevotella sp.]
MKRIVQLVFISLLFSIPVQAQVGEHRDDLSIGFNGGYVLSNIAFVPRVNQTFHGGLTGGLSVRYVCEKYFNTICSVYAELNYSQIGWKEDILDREDKPVINQDTELPEEYQRTMNYFQLPIMAHLAWGKEKKGMNFFFQAGPQFGYFLSDKSEYNFDLNRPNLYDRVNIRMDQDTMSVANKLDYGIAAGVGMEYSHPKIGHFLLEARYYYGLGNIYKDSKRDVFGRSNFNNIVVKLTYLFDIKRTKKQ